MAAARAAATAAAVGRQHVTSEGRSYVLVEGKKRGKDSVVLYWVLQDRPPPTPHTHTTAASATGTAISLSSPTLDSVPDTHIWEVRVDPGRGREFYLNIQSGQKVWELPADGAPGTPVEAYVRKREALLRTAAAAAASEAPPAAALTPAASSPPVRRLAASAAVGACSVVPSPLGRSPVQHHQQLCGWREGSAGTDVFSVLSDETAEPAFLSPIVQPYPPHAADAVAAAAAALHLSPEALFVDFAMEEEEWRHQQPPPSLAAASSAAAAAAPSWRRDACVQPVTASLVADGVLSVRRPAAAASPAPAADAACPPQRPATESSHAAACNPLMGGAAVQAAPACDLNASVVSTWEDEVVPAFVPPVPAAAPPPAAAGTYSSALSTGLCELGGGRGWTPPEASAVRVPVSVPRGSCDVVSTAGDETRGFDDDDDDDDYALCAEEEGFVPTVVTAAPLAVARRWAAAVPVTTAAPPAPAPVVRSDDDAASVADLRQQIAVLMSAQAQHTREVQGLREELRRVRAGSSPPQQPPAQAKPPQPAQSSATSASAVHSQQQPEAGDAQHAYHQHPQVQQPRPRQPSQPSQPRRRLRPSSDGLVHVRPLRRASSSSSSAASTQPAAQGKRGSSGSQRRPLQPIVNQRQPFR